MSADLAFVLEDSLERLNQGETLQACLSRYPEQRTELESMLSVASRLQAQARLRPSPTFRARGRAELRAHMSAHPRRHGLSPAVFPFHWLRSNRITLSRVGMSLATLLLAFALTGTALAQSALPGEALYSWKLTSEHVWRSVSPDTVGVDLVLAERRVDEALAVSPDTFARGVALHGYQKVVTTLQQNSDPSVQQRIESSLKAQQEKLKNAGLQSPLPGGKDANTTSDPATQPHSKNPDVNPGSGKESPSGKNGGKNPPVTLPDPTVEIPNLEEPLH